MIDFNKSITSHCQSTSILCAVKKRRPLGRTKIQLSKENKQFLKNIKISILNSSDYFSYDNTIGSFEFHSYKPYVTSFNCNDEIRIPINQQDLYLLPSASTLYIR